MYILNMIKRDVTLQFKIVVFLISIAIYSYIDNELIIIINSVAQKNSNVWNEIKNFIFLSLIGLLVDALASRVELIRHKIYTNMMDIFIDKVLSIDMEAYEKFSTSKIITIQSNIWTLTLIIKMMLSAIINLVQIIAILFAIYRINTNMAIITIIFGVLLFVITRIIVHKWVELDSEKNELAKTKNKELVEIIKGFKEVRFFGSIEQHRKSLKQLNHATNDIIVKRTMYGCFLVIIRNILGNTIVNTIGLIYGMVLINSGEITSGAIVSIILFIWKLTNPISRLVDCIDGFSEYKAVIKDFVEFINYENKILNGKIKLNCFEDKIVFDKVCFEYDRSNNVLNNIDLVIKRGQKIGICGESGGGKSTLLNLLMRSRDVCSGSITIDGIDIRKLDLASYRHEIGIVSQDIYIFDGTIRENIRYAVPNASNDDMIEACKKASLWNFVKGLPNGLDTYVGPEGLKLSDGQKQRISLARIFLKDPEIILLDEATSSLDNISEKAIKKSLKLLDGKTIIAVAHRLTTIQDYDKIIVIGNHKIVAEGTHNELMKSCKLYHKMHEIKDDDDNE